MDDRTLITVLLIVALAALMSVPAFRGSLRRDPVRGGVLAQIFHLLGVLAYCSVLPTALVGSILLGPFRFGIPMALSILMVSLVMLFLYGVFERPARARMVPVEDHGWTAEDALKSGL